MSPRLRPPWRLLRARTRRLLAADLVLALVLLAGLTHRLVSPRAPDAAVEGAPTGDIGVTVDPGAGVHPISPLIYGVATRDPAAVAGLGATLNRWGGNPSSRYNWVIGHAWNAAADWGFRNGDYGVPSGSASDDVVAGNRDQGMESLITVPALGWVARSDDPADRSVDVPAEGGPAVAPDGRITGYDPTANRLLTSVPSFPRKPGPFQVDPDPASPAVYQDEWVNHLVTLFGPAGRGGVRLYAVDNEPMLWSSTHRDVHPARMGYDDLARVFEEYSSAIKAVDPGALVVGPESWGFTDYEYSDLDRGDDNFATHADRRAHGDVPLIPWFLRTVRRHDAATGRRSLDVLTVHYYPQARGVAGDASDPRTQALRLRSTRSLWDPGYVDESWIDEPVRLIPRLRQWVSKEYPGTMTGITEYNFGGGDSVGAGLAEAEALGVFGREGLDLATYWTSPSPRSPVWLAFRMYRDDDGGGGHFGGTSIAATSAWPGIVSAFASREPGWVDVMLIDKDAARGHRVALRVPGSAAGAAVERFQDAPAVPGSIERMPDAVAAGGAGRPLRLELPAASITLLRIPVRA
jgi:Glycoside hydrolase family 44